jgi:hypothetical protein
MRRVEGEDFDEAAFFAALCTSGARVLLIGRRALAVLGLPVLTADYDLWVHVDDVERLNASVAHLDLVPTKDPAAARRTGRYVLEAGEHVDVLTARSLALPDGSRVAFDDLWARREAVDLGGALRLALPSIPDLILTKRVAGRDKDLADIRLLEALARARGGAA